MRTLMKVKLPIEAGNRAIKDGTLQEIIRKTLETIKAEAAYFMPMDGHRSMIAVFDLKSPADIPRIVEPLFLGLNASVDFVPCMNAEELRAGLSGVT
jgi:hypothetical protein